MSKKNKISIKGGSVMLSSGKIEKMLRMDFKDIMDQHFKDLEEVAEEIVWNARLIVPLKTGKLQRSIASKVMRDIKYPGLVAYASATEKGYDYALIQEMNEGYEHTITATNAEGLEYEEDSGRTAHYLGGSFALKLSSYYASLTGTKLLMSPELEHAMHFILNN